MKKPASVVHRLGKFSLGLGVAGIALGSVTAHAQLTQNITIGNPKALALGHAVTADPPGIDSIHFNPAGLAKIKGRQRQLKVLAAHITYDTQFGQVEIPDESKQALCQVDNECNVENPEEWADIWPADDGSASNDVGVAGRNSSTSKPVLMLPGGIGLTPVPFMLVPLGGIAFEDPNYAWTMATAAYSPMAIGYEREENDPASYQGQQVGISRITYFAPSIGIRFSDTLSLGASIGFSWQGLGIKTKFRAPENTIAFIGDLANDLDEIGLDLLRSIRPYDTIGTLTMEMEDYLSLSFNLGLLWEPTEWIAFGAAYQSESKSNLEGDFRMDYTSEFGAMASSLQDLNDALQLLTSNMMTGPENYELCKADTQDFSNHPAPSCEYSEEGKVTLEFIVPQHLAFGTSIKLLPDLKLNVDVKWTDYKAWDSLDFGFSPAVDFLTVAALVYTFEPAKGDGDNADPDEMRIPRKYTSEVTFALGMEYQLDNKTVLRFGYEPRGSVIPRNRIDLLAPIADADLISFGGGYQIDRYSRVDVGFGWLKSAYNVPAGVSQNANSNLPGRVVYNPFAFTDFKGETNAYILALTYDTKF